VSTVWVLGIVWVCRISNAADCVGLYGPYPTILLSHPRVQRRDWDNSRCCGLRSGVRRKFNDILPGCKARSWAITARVSSTLSHMSIAA
jgi:hypothetical protein